MKWTKEQFCELRNFLMKDPEFKKHYMRTRGGTYGYRRGQISEYVYSYIRIPWAKENDVEDRDQLRRFFDDYWCFPQQEVNKYAHIPDWEEDDDEPLNVLLAEISAVKKPGLECLKPFIQCPLKFNIIPKAPTVATPLKITTKTYINGQDVASLTNSEIFDLITQQENEIEKLKQIKAQPKKLVKELAERQAGIAALVTYLDSQE